MTFSGSSLGTLELQLTANQLALQAQLNQTRVYATKVARDIELQINRAFGGSGSRRSAVTPLPGLQNAASQAASAGATAGKAFSEKFKDAISVLKGAVRNVFSGVFIGAGIGAFNSVTGAIQSAIGAVQGFAGEIFNVTKDFQGFEASLKTFLKGNQQEIDKFVAELEKFAATTPFELKDLQQGAIQNLATGAKPDQIIKDLQTIGNVAAGANASLKDLMEVYAKSRTEGRLQNEDIDQFTGRGVQLRGELAKMLNATEQEVRQLASDGKLEFRHLEEALRRMSAQGGAYFGAMDNKAKTLEGRLSNVNDTFYQFQKSIGQAFEPLMNYGVQIFGDIVAGLTSSKGVLGEVKKESEKLVEYFQANPQLIESLNKAIQELVSGGFKLLLEGIKGIAGYLEKNPDLIQTATDKFNSLLSIVRSVLDTVGGIANWITGAIASGMQLISDRSSEYAPRFGLIRDLCQAIAELFVRHGDLLKGLSDIIANIVNTGFKIIVQLLTEAIKIISQIVSYFRDNLPGAIQGFSQGLEKVLDVCKQIGQAIFGWVSGIGGAAQKAGDFIGNFGGGIQQLFGGQQQPQPQASSGNGANPLGNLVQNAQKLVSEGVERVAQGAQNLLGGSSSPNNAIRGLRYKIVESVGSRIENVNRYEDLAPHHPSVVARGGHKNRPYGMVEGRKEELNPVNRNLIKKDFVLIDPKGKQYGVPVPSPVSGYAGKVGQGWGAVNLYEDKEMTKLIAQVGHMIDLQVKNGQFIQYGQTLGLQAGMGKKGARTYGTHVDMSATPDTYRKYIKDLQSGIFQSDSKNLVQTVVNQIVQPTKQAVQSALGNLPTGAGLSSKAANVVRGKNEGIFQQAGVTDKLVELVKQAEGFAATPYFDRTQYSVGFGTKAKSQGERLSVEQANERLLQELQSKRERVQSMVKVPLNTNQLDALTSFAFNVGDGALEKSTLLKKLNAGNYEGAAAEFGRWNKGEHRGVKQELPGLTRRRKAERDLFLSQQSAVSSQRSVAPYGPPQPTPQLASTPQTTPSPTSSPTGGTEQDQRNLVASRRKSAQQKYREIKEEIDFATQQADAAAKQQRELAAQKREQLNKEKKAQLQLAVAQAPDDEAKQVIERRLQRYEIDSKYEEDLIKLAQQREDLTEARDKKLQIADEAKKRGQAVDFGEEGGKDYTKAINQLDEVIASTKELQKLELETTNLNNSSSDTREEKYKTEQRNINELTRAHEELINKLRLEQEAATSQEIKQKIQIEIDINESKFQLQQALIPLQSQLDELKKRKIYLLGEAGLKDDSEEVKRLQAEIVELEKQIAATTAKSQSDLALIQKEADRAIEAAKFTDQTMLLNKEQSLISSQASVLQGQATLIRNRGGNEYQASALEGEASRMQEQIRYRQELLQIEQQIAAVRGTSAEYTEAEIATMKANAEALNQINLENISQGVRTLGKDLMDVGKNALGGFFTDIITGSKSAGEAFQDLIGNIANQLAQLAVNQLISSIFGGGGGLFGGGRGGSILGFHQGGVVPNYAMGGSVGAIASALQRERSASGRNPVLAALTPGEMVLTVEQAKRFQELRLDKVLNFNNGGVVGKEGGRRKEEEGGGMTINIPVTVSGSNPTSVDVPRLQSSIRGVVVEELLKQQRPGGALNR